MNLVLCNTVRHCNSAGLLPPNAKFRSRLDHAAVKNGDPSRGYNRENTPWQ
jgi:hypothetical protein